MKLFCVLVLLAIPALVTCFKDITFDDCPLTKGCMHHGDCTDKMKICHFGASWKKVVADGLEYIEFELIGEVPGSTGFLSLAFSEDPMLGNDGVVGCYHSFSSYSENIKFYVGYNQRDPRTGEVTNIHIDKFPENFLVTTGDNLGGKFDNVLQCRFRRLVTPTENVEQLKDLKDTNKYYLLHTRGQDLSNRGFGNPIPGGQTWAKEPVAISSLVFGSMTGYPGEGTSVAKAHGAMMVLAWVFCSSVGILLARYYKDVWPNSGLFGERVWFRLHMILQSMCVTLTILGLILILAYTKGEWSKVSTWPHYLHPILGIIVIILTLLNPLIAICRCHPAHQRRPYFNWSHFIIGTVAYILSVPTMMLGLRMPAGGLQLAALDYPNALLVFFVIFQFICEISLEIHGCIYYKRNQNRRHQYEMELDQYTSAIRVQSGPIKKPDEPEPSGRMFKYFMIGLHATVAALVTVILIIIIAVH